MAERKHTAKQAAFIRSFWEAVENGVPERTALELAKVEAGYSEGTDIYHILEHLDQDLLSRANIEIKLALPKAIKGLKGVLEDPEQKGAANVIAASASVLDRAGVVKKEAKEVNITMPSGIAFMPPKIPVNIDAEALSSTAAEGVDS